MRSLGSRGKDKGSRGAMKGELSTAKSSIESKDREEVTWAKSQQERMI